MDRFITRCRVPKRSAERWQSIGEVVRSEFASECRREVLPRLSSRWQVIRIRKLAIELRYTGEFDRERIARAWAKALAAELFATMAHPDSNNPNVLQVASRTEWLAEFILVLASGGAATRWEYEEFADLFKLGTAEGVLTVLQREPANTISVLQLLHVQRRLDKVLASFGDFAFEQLFTIIAREQSGKVPRLTIDDVVKVGQLALSDSPFTGILATRYRALRVFLALRELSPGAGLSGWTPRSVFHALITLDALINVTQTLPIAFWRDRVTTELLTQGGPSLNPIVLGLLEQVSVLAAEPEGNRGEQTMASLTKLLEELSTQMIEKTGAQKDSYWVSGDCVGFLLLAGLIDRFRWPQHILESGFGRRWHNRAVVCFLAGLAQHLLGEERDWNDLAPGVAVFAGCARPASADVGILNAVLSSATNEDRRELLQRFDVIPADYQKTPSSDWTTTFEHVGKFLIQEFASRVRGFRKAKRAFIVNTFLKQSGRICIDERRVLVTLPPNPFHVALHISSIDEPVESVSWLDNRRLEFRLEGL